MSPLTRAGATKYLASRLTNEVVVSNLGQASLDLLRSRTARSTATPSGRWASAPRSASASRSADPTSA